MKAFRKKDIKLLKELIGSSFWHLCRQHMNGLCNMDDMYLLSFSNGISIHIICTLRIISADKILLNTSDEAFTPEYDEYDYCLPNDANCHENNLLDRNLTIVKILLTGKKVIDVIISTLGDVAIEFENGVKIQFFVDAQFNGEFYRIIDKDGNHFIVGYENEKIVFEKYSADQQKEHRP